MLKGRSPPDLVCGVFSKKGLQQSMAYSQEIAGDSKVPAIVLLLAVCNSIVTRYDLFRSGTT